MAENDEIIEEFENLQISDESNKIAQPSANNDEQPLFTLDIAGIVKFIKEHPNKDNLKIITLAGAGISTDAGIPDFRSPKTGLYDNLKQYGLKDPTNIFSLPFFIENPRPFFELVSQLFKPDEVYKPTLAHHFINLLNKKNLLLRHYTQNVDGLEIKAGLPEDKIIEAHGHFRSAHCIKCSKLYDKKFLENCIFCDEVIIPQCTDDHCDGIVKPDIIFFGEALPDRFMQCVNSDFENCDLLIIMGTSLAVGPFNKLPNFVKNNVPRLFINREMAFAETFCNFKFGKKGNTRDVFYESDAGDGVSKLANLLGWEVRNNYLSDNISINRKS